MKKIAIISFILVLVIGYDISSSKAQSKLSGGMRIGLSVSNLAGSDVSGSGPSTTPAGGVFLNYQPVTSFSIQPEVNVVSDGGNYELMLNGFPYHSVRVTYVQVPVLLKFTSDKALFSSEFKPSVFAGPAFNAMIFHSVQGEVLDNVPGGYSVNQKAQSTAFSIVAGIGGTINNLYLVNIRYNYGLTNTFTHGDAKASGIALSVGFMF